MEQSRTSTSSDYTEERGGLVRRQLNNESRLMNPKGFLVRLDLLGEAGYFFDSKKVTFTLINIVTKDDNN